ncbi:MAG: HAMP domain-containing histidine kinase [Chloroflexi bacterium]|nr:HAMP domain-containing histidine kinase [Chloroflexota bacterium]
MFRGLRLRLTLLYLFAASALILLVGGGAYWLIGRYFQTATDLALQHKMALEFQLLGAPLPPELAAADRAWYTSRGRGYPAATTPVNAGGSEAAGTSDGEGGENPASENAVEDAYDGELAAIFVLPLSADAKLLFDPNSFAPPIAPDSQAAAAALAQSRDWRTVRLSNGSRVRLLTYRLTTSNGGIVLQLGRTLSDQDRVLNQLLLGLLGLGGASAVALSVASWWLAGRSLIPAQQAWEKQQAFMANASHELRTPLTLMRASAEVAQRGLPDVEVDRRALLGDVLQECDHMTRLVEDLLLLSRLDAGRLTLERRDISLSELLTDVQRQMGRVSDERGVQLHLGEATGTARADPTRLRQVLLVLLDNALRHTPAGGSISVEARPQGKHVQLTVTDTGMGIPPRDVPQVFERFYRAKSNGKAQNEGTGLGLAIAKALVEAQGGQIRLESREGKGTRVTLIMQSASA